MRLARSVVAERLFEPRNQRVDDLIRRAIAVLATDVGHREHAHIALWSDPYRSKPQRVTAVVIDRGTVCPVLLRVTPPLYPIPA